MSAFQPVALAMVALGVSVLAGCAQADAPLVPDSAIVADTLPQPLTDTPGDPIRGLSVFLDQEKGHCVLCHAVQGLDAPFQGNLAPDLGRVADRLSPGQLRLQVADARRIVPGTIMPSYYRTDGLYRVASGYRQSPVLSAQEVEDVTAYLLTLTGDGA
ncbi:MAG: sulfur oxidation c-type cytochrome SoxX [Pseudomonadota bacterium]